MKLFFNYNISLNRRCVNARQQHGKLKQNKVAANDI